MYYPRDEQLFSIACSACLYRGVELKRDVVGKISIFTHLMESCIPTPIIAPDHASALVPQLQNLRAVLLSAGLQDNMVRVSENVRQWEPAKIAEDERSANRCALIMFSVLQTLDIHGSSKGNEWSNSIMSRHFIRATLRAPTGSLNTFR